MTVKQIHTEREKQEEFMMILWDAMTEDKETKSTPVNSEWVDIGYGLWADVANINYVLYSPKGFND